MTVHLTHRRATKDDLKSIIQLLREDELGKTREIIADTIDQCYIEAFDHIDLDPNHYLMVVENQEKIIATCHLILLPSLSFMGKTRLQIEAVRVTPSMRSQGIGAWMIQTAITYGQSKGATIIQLTTNQQRSRAKKFYEKLGFKSTHEGMKLFLKYE